MPPLRIANGAGFLGDWIDAPRRLVERADVDYLTIEHLAELTMSILARQREKDPNAGYAEDFLDILCSLLPALKQIIPQLRETIILPGCGHWTQQERSAEVNAAMMAFLKTLD